MCTLKNYFPPDSKVTHVHSALYVRNASLVHETLHAPNLILESSATPSSCLEACDSSTPARKPHYAKNIVHTKLRTPLLPEREFTLLVKESESMEEVATKVLREIFALVGSSMDSLTQLLPKVLSMMEEAATAKSKMREATALTVAASLTSGIPINVAIGVAGHEMVLPASIPPNPNFFIPTDLNSLDITDSDDFARYFPPNSVSAFIAEHVWEHLSLKDGINAIINLRFALKVGGVARIAVPDR